MEGHVVRQVFLISSIPMACSYFWVTCCFNLHLETMYPTYRLGYDRFHPQNSCFRFRKFFFFELSLEPVLEILTSKFVPLNKDKDKFEFKLQ